MSSLYTTVHEKDILTEKYDSHMLEMARRWNVEPEMCVRELCLFDVVLNGPSCQLSDDGVMPGEGLT